MKWLKSALIAAAVLLPSVAAAQEVDTLFHETMMKGIEYYNEGEVDPENYQKAIDQFTLARKYSDNPQPIYNIARAYHKLHQCENALHAYREYEAMAEVITEYGTTDVADYIDELNAQCGDALGQLAMSCIPAETEVIVDNLEALPCSEVQNLKKGQHAVKFRLAGYNTATRTVNIEAGKRHFLSVSMDAKQSTVRTGETRRMSRDEYRAANPNAEDFLANLPSARRTPPPRDLQEPVQVAPALLIPDSLSNQKLLWAGLANAVVGVGLTVGGGILMYKSYEFEDYGEYYAQNSTKYKGGAALIGIGAGFAVSGIIMMIVDAIQTNEYEDDRYRQLKRSLAFTGNGFSMTF